MRINRTTYGNRNINAVSILNKVEYDGDNPVGLVEGYDDASSSNFGTQREPRRGGCYRGDGIAYIEIEGLLTTDTFTVFEGSDMPTCSIDGRLDIAIGDVIFGVTVDRTGRYYKMDENSGITCYDSSGNGNHATLINAIIVPPEQDANSIHQYNDFKSYLNDEGYSLDTSGAYPVYIPKDESSTTLPYKDVLGNDLQFINIVPSKASFVDSACWLGDGISYLSITGLLTTDTITSDGDLPTCTIDGRLDLAAGLKAYNVKIERSGAIWAQLPLCEPIIDLSSHTYHDISGNGNHATLINGTVANQGNQNEYHWLQQGFNDNYIPALAALNGNDALGNPLTLLQDGKNYLNDSVAKLRHVDMPRVAQADTYKFWERDRGFNEFNYGEAHGQYFVGNRVEDKRTNITLQPFEGILRQTIVEKVIREVGSTNYFIHSFIFTVSMADAETMVIPATETNDFVIDWGDGTVEQVNIASPSHTYTNAGEYQIVITGTMTAFAFANAGNILNVISVEQFGQTSINSMTNMFWGCSNLIEVTAKYLPDSIILMQNTFSNCSSLYYVNTTDWDVQNVTYFSNLFSNCNSLSNIDVSKWQLYNATIVSSMFDNCSSLTFLDVSAWDVQNVTTLYGIFSSCTSLQGLDVSSWNTSKVESLGIAFIKCSNIELLDVSNWDVSSVAYFNSAFQDMSSLNTLNVSNWDVGKGTNFYATFSGLSVLNTLDVSNWNTSSATNLSFMFRFSNNIQTLNVSNWDVSNVTTLYGTFWDTGIQTLDVSTWNTSNVTDIRSFIRDNTNLTALDVSNFNVDKVTTAQSILSSCTSLQSLNVTGWNTALITDFSYSFYNCTSLADVIGIENWNVSSCTSFLSMMLNVTLPTSRYDAVLNINTGWVSRGMQDGAGANINFGNSTYSLADADAVAGRAAIEAAPNNWVITDGGGV